MNKSISIVFYFIVSLIVIGCAGVSQKKEMPEPAPKKDTVEVEQKPVYEFPKPRVKTDAERVREQITDKAGFIHYLYNKHCKITPNIEGTLDVDIEIDECGQVVSCKVVESTINHTLLVEEIINYLRTFEFENLKDGDLIVTYSFIF